MTSSTYFINTDEGKIAIWDSKPNLSKEFFSVVFIHGHCTHKGFFYPQLESPLFESHRLICLDLPGYGESDKPKNPHSVYSFTGFAKVVANVINSLNLENFIIVGWSLGGHVALEITSYLNKLKGIFIFGTPPIEISEKGLSEGFKVSNPKILECFGKGNLSKEEAELMATLSGYDYTPQKKYMVEAILNTDEGAKTIYPTSILKGMGKNQLDIVKNWHKPIAVIVGEQDLGINNDYIHKVEFSNLWHKKIYSIPHAGHAVHLDQPEKFNQLLHEFLNFVI